MDKLNLKTGDFCKLRDGKIGQFLETHTGKILVFTDQKQSCFKIDYYDDDLTFTNPYFNKKDSTFDIIEIRRPDDFSKFHYDSFDDCMIIWERIEKEKEKEIKKLQEKINENLKIAKELQEQYNKLKNC